MSLPAEEIRHWPKPYFQLSLPVLLYIFLGVSALSLLALAFYIWWTVQSLSVSAVIAYFLIIAVPLGWYGLYGVFEFKRISLLAVIFAGLLTILAVFVHSLLLSVGVYPSALYLPIAVFSFYLFLCASGVYGATYF